ncbi:MAG: EAL domain-containing protein [Gallionella sp.]|nr:EAL domain-containing protein [Gallionella sp.]
MEAEQEKLVTLLKVSQELAGSLDLQHVLQTTTDRITKLSELKSAAVYLLDGETLRLWATTPPLPPQFPEALRNARLADHPHIYKAISGRMPVFIYDTVTTYLTPEEEAVTKLRGLRSILYLPLIAGDKVEGVIIVATTVAPHMLSNVQIDLCRTIANMAAIAIENARLYDASQYHVVDLTQRLVRSNRHEDELRIIKDRYDYVTSVGKVGTWDWDIVAGVLVWNDETFRILGFEPGSVTPSYELFLERVHPQDREMLNTAVHAAQHENMPYSLDCRVVYGEDVERVCYAAGKVEFNERNRPIRMVGIFQDITERKQAEQRIQQMAHFDALTDLPNRTLLNDRVNQAISMAQRSQGTLVILFVDIDHFKNINDTLGHRIGDMLLVEIAGRMESVMRDEDTISRLGGDEFILLLQGTGADGAAHVADKLLSVIARPYKIEQHDLLVTPSIGIAIYPEDGQNLETLSMSADMAMYRAKQEGRNNYRFFTAEMQARTRRNQQLGNALRSALERNQLHVHYQPQIALESGHIIGAEALLRWQHPELGMVSPAEFIPVAEENGMILPIGEWVLRSAVRQLQAWMDRGIAPMVVSVNLSVLQFRHFNLPELVSQILKEEGLLPQYLELELTESFAMGDPQKAIAVMDRLHESGIRMAIDDFGSGYSSLAQLKRFQVYKLKIDQSFVSDLTEDPENRVIVAAIISMANSLGMQTIAEGVETAGQLEFLREKGCNEVQGYYFSKPLPADQFEVFARGKGSFS